MAYCIKTLYKNEKANEIKIAPKQSDFKVQAKGIGNYQVCVRLEPNGEWKTIALVNLRDFSVCTFITTEDIFSCDVTGFYSVSVKNVEGDIHEIRCSIT